MSKRSLATDEQHEYLTRNGFSCGLYEKQYYVRYTANGPIGSQAIRSLPKGWIAVRHGWTSDYRADPISAFVAAEIEQWGA